MWKLICKKEFPNLLTTLGTWSKTNNHNTQHTTHNNTHTDNRHQVSVSLKQVFTPAYFQHRTICFA